VDAAPGGVPRRGDTSYLPTIEPPFEKVFAELSRQKPVVMQHQLALLHEHYDLADRPLSSAIDSECQHRDSLEGSQQAHRHLRMHGQQPQLRPTGTSVPIAHSS
jgi:hypothetical protein